MRFALVLVLITAAGRAVRGDDGYPPELTDRPLLRPAGMWALDLGVDLPEAFTTTTDMGKKTSTSSSLGDTVIPDLELGRSFGQVSLFAGIGSTFYGGVDLQLGDRPVNVFASYGVFPHVDNIHHYDAEAIGVAYKHLVAAHRLALYADASVRALELDVGAMGGQPASSGVITSASAAVSAEVQLARRLALSIGPDVGVPISNSSNLVTSLAGGGGSSLLLALGRFDLSTAFGAHWIRGHRLLTISFGGELRW